jgi:hypothetical protein
MVWEQLCPWAQQSILPFVSCSPEDGNKISFNKHKWRTPFKIIVLEKANSTLNMFISVDTTISYDTQQDATHKTIKLAEKTSIFYRIRRFIIVFTKARHWSLSWVRRIHARSEVLIAGLWGAITAGTLAKRWGRRTICKQGSEQLGKQVEWTPLALLFGTKNEIAR